MRHALLALIAALPLLSPSGPALPKRPAHPALPPTLRVAAVQMRSTRDLDANTTHTIDLLRRCARDGVQVAVFPECSLSGYFDDLIPKLSAKQLADAEQRVAHACKDLGICAIVGSPVRDGRQLYNSALVIDQTGKVRERYHKIQLAERWPDPGDHLSVF